MQASERGAGRAGVASGTLLAIGLVAFGLVFVVLATWLGQYDRAGYALDARAPLPEADRLVADRLGTWEPLRPSGAPPALTADGIRVQLGQLRATFGEAPERDADALLLAWFQMLDGRTAEAVPHLERAARGGGSEAGKAWLLLAKAREASDDHAGVFEAYKQAEVSPGGTGPDAALGLARAHRRAGRRRDAVKWASVAVQRARQWPAAHLELARACMDVRDHARARRAFLDVLQLVPGHEESKQALETMGFKDH